MWYLNNGGFAELNAGIRHNMLGWSVSAGYMKVFRKTSQYDKIWLNNRMMYDSGMGMKPSTVTSGLDDPSSIYSDTVGRRLSVKKPLRSFYLLTGPNVWIGKGKWQGHIALEGGIGYGQMGYYAVNGIAPKPNGSAEFHAPDPGNTPAVYDVRVGNIQYQQFGMSQKYYNKIATYPFTSSSFLQEEPYELYALGRLSADVEYFITPCISVHAGGNFWYMFPPDMEGNQRVFGNAFYINKGGGGMDYAHDFAYTQNFTSSDLKMFSANVGLKFWFGKKSNSKKTTTTTTIKRIEPIISQPVKTSKKVSITVIDELTKTPMGGVNISLKGDNDDNSLKTVTEENGTVMIDSIKPGDYSIHGEIFGIATSDENINSAAFTDASPVIHVTLLYNDPRFILKGVAINTDNGSVEEDVKVSLESGEQKVSQTATNASGNFSFLLQTNTDYQVQGLKNGFYSNIAEASTKGLKRSQTLFVKLKLGMNTVEIGKSFVVKNILYDFNSADIRPDAAIELDRLVAFLNENPGIHIELSSHTDSRGNNQYNMKLSQRRAQSAVNYLISKGISRDRLVAKGYGETRLVNGCADGVPCTEAQHQENRRTEIKIIK